MAATAKKATIDEVNETASTEEALEVAGLDPSYADGRKHPCPCCKANKYRVSNRKTGAGGCDECGLRHTDKVGLVSAGRGITMQAALHLLADHCGLGNRGGGNQAATLTRTKEPRANTSPPVAIQLADDGFGQHPELLTRRGYHPLAAERFCENLYGGVISIHACQDVGMELVEWQQSADKPIEKLVGIPIYSGPELRLCNWTLYGRSHGKRLAYGLTQADKQAGRLFDRNGICLTQAARDLLLRGEPIDGLKVIKMEGQSDLLGLLSILPTDEPYLAWTNNDGARSTNCAEWLLPMIDRLNPAEFIVIHDRDDAGINGAKKWCKIFSRQAPTKNVMLPMDYQPTKGPDFLDWLKSGATLEDFERLIDSTPVWGSDEIDLDGVGSNDGGDGSDATGERDQSDASGPNGSNQPTEKQIDSPISIRSFGDMSREFTQLRPERIEGLLRDTELLNIIAAPKIGKSYLVGGMAVCIATGREWMGRPTRQGRVLIIDNELHPELTTDRLSRIVNAMAIPYEEVDEQIDVLSLRGACVDIDQMEQYFSTIKRGDYGLIVLDALYRTLPAGASENDNAAMTAIFNKIDRYAELTGSAFAIVHHSSKGDQADKSITDMGSGAGSISRATDTHLVIRPHEQDGMAVLEAVTRSFRQVEPISIQWSYPLWEPVAAQPTVRRRKPPRNEAQAESDQAAKNEILEILKIGKPIQQQKLIEQTGISAPRMMRLLNSMMKQDKSIEKFERKKKGSRRRCVFWQVLTAVLTAKEA